MSKRRGREDAVHSALDAARMDRKTLKAMLGAMEDSFPMFRKYFKAKAKKLGRKLWRGGTFLRLWAKLIKSIHSRSA